MFVIYIVLYVYEEVNIKFLIVNRYYLYEEKWESMYFIESDNYQVGGILLFLEFLMMVNVLGVQKEQRRIFQVGKVVMVGEDRVLWIMLGIWYIILRGESN